MKCDAIRCNVVDQIIAFHAIIGCEEPFPWCFLLNGKFLFFNERVSTALVGITFLLQFASSFRVTFSRAALWDM